MLSRRHTLAAFTPLAGPALGSERPLRLASALLPPYVLEAGDPRGDGIDVDIAREALRLGGSKRPVELSRLPWQRALLMLQLGQADFSIGVRITEERRRFLRFSRGYGEPVQFDFYSAQPACVRRGADLAGLRLGLVVGNAYPTGLLALLGSRVDRVQDLRTLMRMTAAGRLDACAVSHLPGRWLMDKLQLAGSLVRQPWSFQSGDQTHMGFSLRAPGFEEAAQAMDRGLALLEKRGAWSRFERPYLSSSAKSSSTV